MHITHSPIELLGNLGRDNGQGKCHNYIQTGTMGRENAIIIFQPIIRNVDHREVQGKLGGNVLFYKFIKYTGFSSCTHDVGNFILLLVMYPSAIFSLA